MFTGHRIVAIAPILTIATRSGGERGTLHCQGMVYAVFNGDTVLLVTGRKVRYPGIDAPEEEHGGETSARIRV